jgi:hypothetical protein
MSPATHTYRRVTASPAGEPAAGQFAVTRSVAALTRSSRPGSARPGGNHVVPPRNASHRLP